MPVVPLYLLLMAFSLLVGCLVPWFYEWTGSEQSRMSPLVGQAAIAMCVLAAVVCAALPWAPLASPTPRGDARPRFRFTIRLLLAATAALAVVVAAGVRYPLVVSGALCAVAYGYAGWVGGRSRDRRWPIAALLACMLLPFVWVFFYEELERLWPSIFWIMGGAPVLFSAILINSLLGQGMNETPWLAVLLTAVELALGVWLVQQGPRRAIAYIVIALLVSTFGSFVLNALVRA
ncbi:hypothetical protein Pla123a_33240 [Posidoniimonas polymericola]|uniref:Uncharacterized protein n=2 Tax=Posidoniimonas polymericola TaxID=2528002 RepID=A0A5C5YHR9_9BACT|nr:hypothetical protein Pla123a_33240 [Posidoniimonas polymericola]